MREIIIGTSNKFRFESLSTVLRSIDGSIKTKRSHIPIKEIGKDSLQNAVIKVSAYLDVGKEVLCSDEELILDNKKYNPGTHIRRSVDEKVLSRSEIVTKWQTILSTEHELNGRMVKSFAFLRKDLTIVTTRIIIPLFLKENKNLKSNVQPLNNFIYPIGFLNPISAFTRSEKDRFKGFLRDGLEKIIARV